MDVAIAHSKMPTNERNVSQGDRWMPSLCGSGTNVDRVTQRANNQKKSKTRNLESMRLYCIIQSKVL